MSGAEREDRDLITAGYVTAILIPIIGLILGIIAATRERGSRAREHGVRIILGSVAGFIIWGAIAGAIAASSVHHAEQHIEQTTHEVVQSQQRASEEVSKQNEEAAERAYCHEHPHAGEHEAGGKFYYGCTPMYEGGE